MSRPRFLSELVFLFVFVLGIGALGIARLDARGRPVKMSLLVNLADVNKEKAAEFFSAAYDVANIRIDGSAEVIATSDEYEELLSHGYDVTVLIPDLDSRLVSLYGRSTGLGLLTAYHSYDEMVLELQTISSDHPTISVLEVIGTSIEGRDIYAMKVSDNASVDEEEPEVLFTGLHHAREPITVEICLDLLNYLTDGYGVNPQITTLVDERETWVVPIVNPDGYEYAQNVDAWWRKNRRYNNGGTRGVDINRNYGYRWGWDNSGSSSHGGDETYRGTGPFSEPETRAVRDLSAAHDFSLTVTHHSYGNWILYPWGFVYGPTQDDAAMGGIAGELSTLNGYTAGRTSTTLYKTNGDFTDWQYGETGRKSSNLSYTIETGSDFYPPDNMIPQLIQEGRDHNLYFLSVADRPYQFAPPPPRIIEPMPIDYDGTYDIVWGTPNQGKRDIPDHYELQEMTGKSIVTDDVESGTSNFILDGFSQSGTWSHSGTKSLYSGSGDARTSTARIVTDHKVRVGDVLTFWTWYDLEVGWDYAYVEVSTDGGLTFRTLPGDITTTSNPNGNNEGNGINGSSNGWVFASFDLSDYLGDHIVTRFRYSTDQAVQGTGFYVDDISPISDYASVVTLSSTIFDTAYAVSGRVEDKYYYRARGIDVDGQWSDWSPVEAVWIIAAPYVDLLLTPDTTEVVPGGSLGFTAEITNSSLNQETFEVWLDVTMPDGRSLPWNPYMGPFELNLSSGGSVSRHVDLPIPGTAPVSGPWTVHLRSGNNPAGIISEDSFQFDIVAPVAAR